MDDVDGSGYEKELQSYPHQQLGLFRNGGVWPTPRYRYSLIACARWEARYIVEWVLYHRSIGIDHIYLYCNDDEPIELYQKLIPFIQDSNPYVTFIYYGLQGHQLQMYFHYIRNHSHETEWMMFLDIDEFMCVRGSNSIPMFMDSMPSAADAIYFNWCSFGNNGHQTRPDGEVLLNYTRREKQATPLTKVFIKSSRVPYQQLFWAKTAQIHHDYTVLDPAIITYNVLQDRLYRYYENFPINAWDYLNSHGRGRIILNIAFIAHYNIKSDEDFKIRVDRGLKGDFESQKMWDEKSQHDQKMHHLLTNEVEDFYLHDYWRQYLSQGLKHTVFPISKWPLVSQGKPATQSSTAHLHAVQQDAQMIVSGRLFGASQNHTQLEDDPWWQVDLGEDHVIHEFRLYNRMDGALDRMAQFEIAASDDAITWTTVFARTETRLFGGIDGTPFIWISDAGFTARFIRLTARGRQRYLHLDQIEFYGAARPG